jgi:hypothetical protein
MPVDPIVFRQAVSCAAPSTRLIAPSGPPFRANGVPMRNPLVLAALLALSPSFVFAGKSLKGAKVEDLMAALNGSDAGLRAEAAKYLGDTKVESAIPDLVRVVRTDPDTGVRKSALNALVEYSDEASIDAFVEILHDDKLSSELLDTALKRVLKRDATRADDAVPYYLSRYRKNTVEFNVSLLDALQAMNRQDTQDLPLVIVMDSGQKRRVRVKALDVLEKRNHPGIYEAYFALLNDDEKPIKIRCIQGLSRSGLPAKRVSTALEGVVRNDKQGDVRAAAMKALKFYANPGLLPLLHYEALNEMHPMAWGHAVDLLLVIADASSYSTLIQLIGPDKYVSDEWTIKIIHILIRIGDPGAIPALASLRDRSETQQVKVEAQRAIDLLAPERMQERLVIVQGWVPPPDIIVVQIDASASASYQMSVQVDSSGVISGSAGASWGFVGAEVRVSGP